MKSLQGHLLIASPTLLDPNFRKSVVLLVQHNDEGAMGLVLNRPTETKLREAWMQVAQTDCASEASLNLGGPCEGPLMALHTEEVVGQVEVFSEVFFSAEADRMQILVETGFEPTRYFVGYSGWSSGQLESELESGAWLTTAPSIEQVLRDNADLWDKVMKQIDESVVSAVDFRYVPDDPSMN